MIAPLREFQDCILTLGASTGDSNSNDPLLFRLAGAIRSIQGNNGGTGQGDLAALIRQCMVRAELGSTERAELRVPRDPRWPTIAQWSAFGCATRIAGPQYLFVHIQRRCPEWIDEGGTQAVEAAIAQHSRRPPREIPSDPTVRAYTGLEEYITPGQRIAVQSSFLTPDHSTVIVNLPTGSGKTLTFQLPALASGGDGGLTVVVVPTIALAKDQEQRFRSLQRRGRGYANEGATSLAYHSGLSDEQKQEVKAAIFAGRQSIVFTSPESLGGALRGPLFDAAKQGRLRLFVIDEAHIVTQWGQQFRPEFQSIAGMRDALLAQCPEHARFRTMLLTGTLTQECYDALRLLFGDQDCQLVGEPALRPEPGFLLYTAVDEVERRHKVLEALRFLPRPLILYTTTREDALAWPALLEAHGFLRVRLVRGGDLADDDGDEILKDWQERKVDIIVATSAFGLGVDHSEVRSVVHACLPETIDRYYQEVGRAGRDGCASVALLVSTPEDRATARGLAIERLISVDRGFERWDAMWIRRSAREGKYVISLHDRPADIPQSGVRNVSWNLRTLVLMAQARLIRFTSHEPLKIEQRPEEDSSDFETRQKQAFERFAYEVAVQIIDDRHWDKNHWEIAVDHVRSELRARDTDSLNAIFELQDLRRPLNEIFREAYALSDPPVTLPGVSGNCPVTRLLGTAGFYLPEPQLIMPSKVINNVSAEFTHAMAACSDKHQRAWLLCPQAGNDAKERRNRREALVSFLKYAVTAGIQELSLPDGTLTDSEWLQLNQQSKTRFLVRSYPGSVPEINQLPLPKLTLINDTGDVHGEIESAMKASRPWHIILFRDNTPDPRAKQRNLIEVMRYLSIDAALARLRL
jgi:ATP-dependent DNA helicase RecQ